MSYRPTVAVEYGLPTARVVQDAMLIKMMTRQRSAVPVDNRSSCRIVQLAVLDAMRALWSRD